MTITSLHFDTSQHSLSVYELKFIDWYRSAKPKDMFTYYTGMNLSESIQSLQIKHLAWKHAIKGKVYLVQRRNTNVFSGFDFMAIKSSDQPCKSIIPLDYSQIPVKFSRAI